ncbi:MAG: c-type cytochrome [Terriglobales bacterium]
MRIITAILVCVIAAMLAAFLPGSRTKAGDSPLADKGARLIESNGCGTCHDIPGIDGADGVVGPPLGNMGRRVYIAGLLRNTPQNMASWIQHPQRYVPGNAMPELGLTRDEAQAISAYLQTLR